jgi:membrane protein
MKIERIRTILYAVKARYADPYYHGKPAELSFYFMFSLTPAVILLIQLLAYVSITPAVMENLLGNYLSEQGLGQVSTLLDTTSTGGFSIVFGASALWGASKVQYAVMRLSNYAYTGSPRGSNVVLDRIRAVKNSLLTLFSLLFGLIILVYGDMILNWTLLLPGGSFVMQIVDAFGAWASFLWDAVRWLLGVALYYGSVLYLFYNAPSEKMQLRRILPGSLVSASGMVIVTAVYSLYAKIMYGSGSSSATIYGGFASVTVLLFWFFLLGYTIVAGVVLNATLLGLGEQEPDGDDSLAVE